ncbi:plasmodesmata-located protein 8 [Quercus suber]|uniref:plasmodesmata-located protein 8 n=1 Tax=Quercus suber TaxID=58331 RepID=UPI0032DEA9EA
MTKKQPLLLFSHHHSPSKHKTKTEERKAKLLKKKTRKKMLRSLQLHSTHKTILVLRLLCLLFLLSSLSSHGYPVKAHIFIYAGCSQEKYQPNSPFEANVNSFLASLASSSSQVSYNSLAIGNGSSPQADGSSPQADGSIYGLFQCRGDLKILDCSQCIQSAVTQIGLVCPYSYGASLQLEGCYIRYEHADFLGKLDTSLRHTKCSKSSVSSDVDFFRRRDDVLADLQGTTGFRVSSSGLVEGFAQCLGDLNPTDCSSCVADAVGKLKTVCGSASASDVYLAQCYARYWASGYYDSSSDSTSEDQVGKTVAIIVGVLAGVAVLIVLLSVCRKKMG